MHNPTTLFLCYSYQVTSDALESTNEEYNISDALILGTEDASSTGSKLGKLKCDMFVQQVRCFIAILLGPFIHFQMRAGLCYFVLKQG